MNKFNLSDTQLYAVIKTILSADKVDRANIKVYGHSMTPFIKSGSTITLKPFNTGKGAHLGDVLAVKCTNSNTVLVHRVVGVKADSVLLKGDNNPSGDGWFSNNCIIGIIDKINGNGFIKKDHRFINILIALGSRTTFLNRILLPLSRTIKKKLTQNE